MAEKCSYQDCKLPAISKLVYTDGTFEFLCGQHFLVVKRLLDQGWPPGMRMSHSEAVKR